MNATGLDSELTREDATAIIGYPECVNETYGLMSSECLIDAFGTYGVRSRQEWVTFDQAYSICSQYTGVINPIGMYHYMAIRGVSNGAIWVANSARGYLGVYDTLSRNQFNSYSPVQVIYLEDYGKT